MRGAIPRERPAPEHVGKAQGAIEMGKERAPARHIPAQSRSERLGVDRDEEKVGLAGKMFGGRFGHLIGCRKMNEASY